MPEYPVPGTFEMITVADTAIGITSTIYKPVTGKVAGAQPFYALVSVTGAGIRYTMDGTTPVATTTGHYLADGDSVMVSGFPAIMGLRMIRETSTSGLVAVTCFF